MEEEFQIPALLLEVSAKSVNVTILFLTLLVIHNTFYFDHNISHLEAIALVPGCQRLTFKIGIDNRSPYPCFALCNPWIVLFLGTVLVNNSECKGRMLQQQKKNDLGEPASIKSARFSTINTHLSFYISLIDSKLTLWLLQWVFHVGYYRFQRRILRPGAENNGC
ncbi:hypothetical protein OUZ56_032216 [Daphnia magna]|uniref:Uncharacterized protein n=1 Tax=Daphnia magna TaxID=35525 RepID=A0ABQ9ZWI2_9CRUS|nr:hypothetical protein OUZ56_032216 [Daphnia magna]